MHSAQITDTQMGIFCLVGSAATLVLMPDPIYLGVLCGFLGGGDMNGIMLLPPETAVRITAGILAAVHGWRIWKYLLSGYRKSFA